MTVPNEQGCTNPSLGRTWGASGRLGGAPQVVVCLLDPADIKCNHYVSIKGRSLLKVVDAGGRRLS